MSLHRFDEIALNSIEKKKPTEDDKEHYIGLEHLDSQNLFVTRWGSDIAPKGEKLIMHKGDVLFGKRRAYQKKVAIAPFDGIFSAHGMVLRPKTDVVDPLFFPLFIASDYFLDAAINISVGSLSPTINWSDLKSLEFNLPDLDTQQKIAKVLWAIQQSKKADGKLLQETDELVKSQFIEMFSDVEKRAPLESLCSVFTDGDWIESKDQAEEGIRLIQTGNVGNAEYIDKFDRAHFISEDTFARLSCTEVLPGDVLISRLPDPIARCCIVPNIGQRAITAVDCTIVRFKDNILPQYFEEYTLTPAYANQIQNFVTGSTRQRISRKNLGSVLVPVPNKNLQKAFIDIVEQSDKSKAALRKAIDDLDAMYKRILKDNLG
jgi:type I restriction enzyme S subunit